MLRWICACLFFISAYSAFAQSDECEFAGHGTSAYDAANRRELAPCSDGFIRASLTSCRDTRSQNKKKGKAAAGSR